MTCYNSSVLIVVKFIFTKKSFTRFLSGLFAVISINESTQIYDTSYDLQPGLYLQIPTENHQCDNSASFNEDGQKG